MNIRTLIRLEKSYPPGVFSNHPDLFTLSSRSTKRVCQKELEELVEGGSVIHVDDLKHIMKKWSSIDHNFTSLPANMKRILDEFNLFKNSLQLMINNKVSLIPLDLSEMNRSREFLSGVTGYSSLGGLDSLFELA